MNVKAQKFELIEWLIQVQDNSLIEKLAEIRNEYEIAKYEASLKPMSSEQLIERALASEKAIENGEYSDIDSIINEDWD
ncbi:MAG: hypothetical protein AB8G22_17795 [Saprospiraceae bacterium]